MCPVGLTYIANYAHISLHYFYTVQILCIILNSQDHCQNNSLTLEIWLDLQKPSLMAQELKSNLLLNIESMLLHYLEMPNLWL